MFNKYKLVKADSRRQRYIHTTVLNKVCYIAYLKVGERGWFLYETDEPFEPPHRIHTSIVENIEITNNQVIVKTENTEYVFELIEDNHFDQYISNCLKTLNNIGEKNEQIEVSE